MLNIHFKNSPFKLIASLYLLFIAMFTFLYLLPSAHNGELSLIDAWFLSTSGMSVTGLSTVNVSEKLTTLGQSLLMIQFQIGGIGIMAVLGSLLVIFRRGVSLSNQTLMSFDQNQRSLKSINKLMIFIFLFAITLELIGILIFTPILYFRHGDLSEALFQSTFHAIASFTNSGFDLFGNSLISFASDPVFVLATASLILFGIIGFPTILELFFSNNAKKSLFTKVNLSVHGALLALGFSVFLLFESSNSFNSMSLLDKLTNALFLSVTSRNGGLTTLDVGTLTQSSLFLLMLLMFIGSSASSCGGGIKTTTFGVLVANALSVVKGRDEVVIFKKSLHHQDVQKAFLIFFVYFCLFFFSTLSLSFVEDMPLRDISFEVMSALTTTGLSTGITSTLSVLSKFWLSVLMIIGRIGVIVLIYSIVKPKKTKAKYIKEHVIVG